MRFRFFTPVDEAETAAYLAALRSADALWAVVGKALRASGGVPSRDWTALERRLDERAAAVDEGLSAQIQVQDGRTLEVVIAPRQDASLWPLAEAVVERAPPLHGLRPVSWRSPVSLQRVLAEARSRFGVDLASAEARAGFSRGHLLEVVVCSPEVSSARDERALDAATFVVARLLGDAVFERWIGAVDVAPAQRRGSLPVLGTDPERASVRFPLHELGAAVDAGIAGLRAQLSDVPYHRYCEHSEWTMLDVEPSEERSADGDFPLQDDLVLCSTMLPEMMKCYLQGSPFASERFSNRGEVFCYLKMDGAGRTPEGRLEQRLALEDALNVSLVPGGVGCVVGVGMGLRYAYVVLALQNLEHGIRLVRAVAARRALPRRSWLLFCDSEWAREWVGLQDETPPPPPAGNML